MLERERCVQINAYFFLFFGHSVREADEIVSKSRRMKNLMQIEFYSKKKI